MPKHRKPVILISLDGWGISPVDDGNAIEQAATPVLDDLMHHYPFAFLEASGIAVGLPWGEVGNSEVGHLNLGAGQVVYQNLPRIQLAIENKEFFSNEVFLQAIAHVKKHKSNLHLVGILSSGGVHGHIDHALALLQLCKNNRLKDQVFIHGITDGRDTAPDVAKDFVAQILKACKKMRTGQLATLIGRYYALDRNHNWNRTKLAYDVMVKGLGLRFNDPIKAINEIYKQGMRDEELQPIVLVDRHNNPLAQVKDNDAVIFWNYRPDRARQLTQAFVNKDFSGFPRELVPKNLFFATMMEYEQGLPVKVAFAPHYIKEPVGKIVAEAGLKQLRIAETEKYAHVTYFFNGGSEAPYKNEDDILVPSPDVATYDLKPEMAAAGITKEVVAKIKAGKYDFIMLNFANADMLGHTGDIKAAIKGIETIDACLGQIVKAVQAQGGAVVITADHGNAEIMKDPLHGKIVKEHTTSVVPLLVIDEAVKREIDEDTFQALRRQINPLGILADVGPTVLDLLGLKPSSEMTGRSLLHDLM